MTEMSNLLWELLRLTHKTKLTASDTKMLLSSVSRIDLTSLFKPRNICTSSF